MTDKTKIKELIKRVDEVLFYVWDPIGVSKFTGARDEYSSYALTIISLVIAEDIEKLTDVLTTLEKDIIGPAVQDDHNREVAERLIAEKKAVEEGLS